MGSVRTGIDRLRHAVTTFWRSTPGADGIAMTTSSGSTSSSTRGSSSWSRAPLAGHAHALLARVVVDEADRALAELGVAAQLGGHQLAAVARTDDQYLVVESRCTAAGAAGAP